MLAAVSSCHERTSRPVNKQIAWVSLLLLTLILSACGTIATPVWQAADARAVAQPTAIPATSTPPPTVTPEPTPTLMATSRPPTATPSPLPPTALPTSESELTRVGNVAGDAANGEALFNTFQGDAGFACATCHRADSEDRLIGPGLLNVGARAETRVDGTDTVEYIRTSIINPGAYVVETFPDGLMPQNWADIYAEDEINDLIAYLLTLE
jgi:cytochrome c2